MIYRLNLYNLHTRKKTAEKVTKNWNWPFLTLFRMREPKSLLDQFFPCNFHKCRNYPPKLSDFYFKTFLPRWCKISRPYLVSVPNHWTWTKTTPENKQCFWSKPYTIDVVKTSLIELLELQTLVKWPHLELNLSHVIKFCWWYHR